MAVVGDVTAVRDSVLKVADIHIDLQFLEPQDEYIVKYVSDWLVRLRASPKQLSVVGKRK